MVVKFGVQQQRGSAGESAFGPKRGYNFANLYASNRSDDQTQAQVNKIGNQVTNAQNDVDKFGQQAAEAAGRGMGGEKQPMNQMASAVESARQGSMAAQQYDPAANIMKKTTSPYQAGIGSFYAGGIAAKGAARKFGNTFDQVQATARNWQERMPGMVASGVADKQRADQMAAGQEQDRKNALFASAQEGYRNSLDEAARTGGMQDPHRMDNLTWLLRTGRISAEEMYAAQKDERLYNELLKRGDYGSSGNAPRR